jgi:hypothetical protein
MAFWIGFPPNDVVKREADRIFEPAFDRLDSIEVACERASNN